MARLSFYNVPMEPLCNKCQREIAEGHKGNPGRCSFCLQMKKIIREIWDRKLKLYPDEAIGEAIQS